MKKKGLLKRGISIIIHYSLFIIHCFFAVCCKVLLPFMVYCFSLLAVFVPKKGSFLTVDYFN